MLHMYNCILLKMSIWGSKHVEENSALWINNNRFIKSVINIQSINDARSEKYQRINSLVLKVPRNVKLDIPRNTNMLSKGFECACHEHSQTHTERLCVCLDIIQYFQYRPQFRIVWFVCKVIVISVYPFTQNNSTPTGQIWLLRVFVAKFRGCFGWGHAALSLSLSPTFTSSVNIGSMKKKRSRSECERSILTYCIKSCKIAY